jgi:4-amino-4-deoxy-L-arabinose transferase-like glycosyltransferase
VSADTRRLAAIVVIALIVRMLLAVALGGGFHFADEIRYVDAARQLWTDGGFGSDYSRVPGYPVLLALLGGPWQSVLWLRLAQAAVAGAGAALTFMLADRCAGRTAALAAAIVYALDPLTAFAAGLLYPEATAALLFAGAVLAAMSATRRDSAARAALTGALLGTLALFRPVALALVPVTAAWIAVVSPGPAARRVGHAATVVLVWLVVLAPWTYRNYQLRGQFVPVSLTGTRGAALSPEMQEQQGLAGALVSEAASDPVRVAWRMAREFGHFWELVPERLVTDSPAVREALHRRNPGLPTTPVAPEGLRNTVAAVASVVEFLLAIIGLIALWRAHRRETVLLVGMVLVFALGHSLFVGKIRYRITVLPAVFVFVGTGVAVLWQRAGERSPSGAVGPVA